MASPERIDMMLRHLEQEIQMVGLLSDWEISFVESISDQWAEKMSLSPAQIDKLEEVYKLVAMRR